MPIELSKDALRGETKDFSAKFNDDEKLGIIALHQIGVKTTVLALAFNANRRTIGKLVGNNLSDYIDVKKIAKKYEPDQLYGLYVTDEMIVKVNEAAKKVKANQL